MSVTLVSPAIARAGADAVASPAQDEVRVALRADDPLRRRMIARALGALSAEAAADVTVIDLPSGERPPAETDGSLLVLTDDPALWADTALAGVLPRAATERQIAAAVAAIAEGLTVRPAAPLAEPPAFAPPDKPARALLTPRELEILAAVGQGMSNKAIARRLGISAHTVKYHLEAIFSKLSVRSRAEAVTRGLRHGLLVV